MTRKREIALRAARPEEAGALSRIAFASKAHWGYDADFMAACRDELTVSEAHIGERNILVAECDGVLLGFGGLCAREDGEPEIWHLFVAPEAMGHGVGRLLTEALIDHARASGAPRLWVESDPNAESFYQACGFHRVGETPSGSIAGRSLPLLVMELGEK